jgi:hypothetical protein
LEVSWAQVHDRHDRPVPFAGRTEFDEVLALLAAGVSRDHVALSARGVVEGRKKYDELLVPAGARFTFEIVLHRGGTRTLSDVLALLASPHLRIGGGSRDGLGRFRVVRVLAREFDVTRPDDRAALARLPRCLSRAGAEQVLQPRTVTAGEVPEGWFVGKLELKPLDYWMIGGGEPTDPKDHLLSVGDDQKPVDMVPIQERRIQWVNGQGSVTAPLPTVPATAVKGALRHRAEFHARREAGCFQDPMARAEPGKYRTESENRVLKDLEFLFGSAKQDDDQGAPGRFFLSDGVVAGQTSGLLQHVSLDRFTQAPMDHLLFTEAPWYRGTISLDLAFHFRKEAEPAWRAMEKALDDLCNGRLAMGAGSSRGHGYCQGTVTWQGGKKP